MPTTKKRNYYHIPGDVLRKIEARAPRISGGRSTSDGITTVARRYFALLDAGTREVNQTVTDNELKFICEISNGISFTEESIPTLPGEIEDADPGIIAQYGIDEYALARKVEELSLPALYAIVDAVERFWMEPALLKDTIKEITADVNQSFGESGDYSNENKARVTERVAGKWIDVGYDDMNVYECIKDAVNNNELKWNKAHGI